jgi:phage terminase large subunit-like protein
MTSTATSTSRTTSETSSTTSTYWTGSADEYRPPRYESPEALLDDGRPWPSMGRLVGAWIERNLVHGEGDVLGEPVRLQPFQREMLRRLYQYDPVTGQLRYDRALFGLPRGSIKTELIGNVGDAELLGPIAPRSPNVPVVAASFDQADRIFSAARLGIEGDGQDRPGPLARFFNAGEHIQDTVITRPDRPGRLYRVAAVAGTNEGGLPSCVLCDEVHEWEGERRERVWTVMSKGARKRRVVRPLPRRVAEMVGLDALLGALHIGITTAGDTLDSLLGRLYAHGVAVATGETEDPSYLFMWWSTSLAVRTEEGLSEGWDLEDEAERAQAILEANPAIGSALTLAGVEASYRDPTVPLNEFLRYNLNLFVSSVDAWLAESVIESRRVNPRLVTPPPPPKTPIVVGFDGSNNRDCTVLVGWTVADDYGFVIAAWEPEDGEPVPRTEVDAAVARAFATWDVVELAGDPPGWRSELERWEAEFGTRGFDPGDPTDGRDHRGRVLGSGRVLRFPTFNYALFGPACAAFKTAMLVGGPRLDGHPLLMRHLRNARSYDTRHGQVIVKDSKNSVRRIDAADAAVIARSRAVWHRADRSKVRRPVPQAVGF